MQRAGAAVVSVGGRSGCHHFGGTPFCDDIRTKKKTTCLMLLEMFSKWTWASSRKGAGGQASLDFHTLSLKPPKFQKIFHF